GRLRAAPSLSCTRATSEAPHALAHSQRRKGPVSRTFLVCTTPAAPTTSALDLMVTSRSARSGNRADVAAGAEVVKLAEGDRVGDLGRDFEVAEADLSARCPEQTFEYRRHADGFDRAEVCGNGSAGNCWSNT